MALIKRERILKMKMRLYSYEKKKLDIAERNRRNAMLKRIRKAKEVLKEEALTPQQRINRLSQSNRNHLQGDGKSES